MEVHDGRAEPWKVTLVDTGEYAQTGGRLLAVSKYIQEEESFCLTYGDGVSNVDVRASIEFHSKHRKLATVTSVFPPGRFGALETEDSVVKRFMEKPKGDGGRINGGFFVLSPGVLTRIENSESIWEQGPLKTLANEGELMAFEHDGFWQPMDTLRDKNLLEKLWHEGKAPWRVW